MSRRSRSSSLWLGSLLLVAACKGEGSDIGPKLETDVQQDWRIVVQDQDGRPISSARISIEGYEQAAGATDRHGRAKLLTTPGGIRRITIDARFGTARDGDRYDAYVVEAQTGDGAELPWVASVPDLGGGTGLVIPTGIQTVTGTLDDRATSGALLTIPAGTSVGYGAATTVTLSTGALGPQRIPLGIPAPAAGGRHTTRGVMLAPTGVTFSPGATLALANELGLADSAQAELWRLDPLLGTWNLLGTGTVSSGSIVADVPIPGGGFYCFARVEPVTTTLTGRIVGSEGALASALPLTRVLVRADGAIARTDDNGRFTLPPIAARDAQGMPRSVRVTYTGGRLWLPRSGATDVTLVPGAQTVIDQRLETSRVADLRMQLVAVGSLDPGRVMRGSSSEFRGVHLNAGNDQATAVFEDIDDFGYFGTMTSRPYDREYMLVTRGAFFLGGSSLFYNVQMFASRQGWWIPRDSNGGTSVYVLDALGTGPVRDAAVIRGAVPEQGLNGYTNEFGAIEMEFGDDQATGYFNSGLSGRSTVSAMSFVYVDTARLEMPVGRVRRTPLGVYDRHGLYGGTLLGSGAPGRALRVRATRRLALQDWYEAVMLDRDPIPPMPKPIDPQVLGGTAYRIGVPVPEGELAAVEGFTGGGEFVLERIGLRSGLRPVGGTYSALDLPLDRICDTDHRLQQALVNRDPALPDAAIAVDLALELGAGRIVDVARGIGGLDLTGSDLGLRLPALTGPLASAKWHVALVGRFTDAAGEHTQRTWTPLTGTVTAALPLMPVPEVLEPPPDAMVSAAGFRVRWVTPPNALYMKLELFSELDGNVREWTAVVPGYLDSFDFRRLAPENPQPIVPGRTYRLRVSAMRVGRGFIKEFTVGYQAMLTNYVGLHECEREVEAISTTEFTVTTQ